jgi:hypothetical protein
MFWMTPLALLGRVWDRAGTANVWRDALYRLILNVPLTSFIHLPPQNSKINPKVNLQLEN